MEPCDIITSPDGKVYTVQTIKTPDVTERATFVTLWGRGGYRKTEVYFTPSLDHAMRLHNEICTALRCQRPIDTLGTCAICVEPTNIEEAIPESIRRKLARQIIDATRK